MPTIRSGDLTLNYEDGGGDGKPVVLLHAFPLDGRMWDPQMEALGDRFRMIAIDFQGFGKSDAPDDPAAYSMDAYADEVRAVIEAVGVDRPVLAGLSMGGYVAFAFLRRHPNVIGGLVLADTRAEADPPEGVEKRTSQQEQVRAEGTAGLIDALPKALLSPTTWDRKPDVVATVKGLMDQPPAGYVGALEALKTRPDSTGDLSKIDVPTLVIVGEDDGLTPPNHSRSMHEAIGGSRLAVLPEAGHLSNLESPDAFNGALADFLSEVDSS